MKVTNKQVIEFINGLYDTGLTRKRLPVKVAYAISRNVDQMNAVATSYETARKGLIEQMAEKADDGTPRIENGEFVFSERNRKEFSDAIRELLEIENEMEIHTVNFDELEKCDTDKYDSLSAADLMVLELMTN